MATFQDVLQFIGYKSEEECIAYVKVMAYQGCFGDSKKYIAEQKYHPQCVERYHRFTNQLSSILQNTNIKFYNEFKTQVITDVQAKELLNLNFSTLEQGFNYLYYLSEIYFLRKSFFMEGINPINDSINMNRWQKREKKVSQSNITNINPYLSKLNLIDKIPWPTELKSNHIVIFFSLQHILEECIRFIPADFEGQIDCLGSTRGLFNFEPALVYILADMFNMPEKVEVIQKVLSKYQEPDTSFQWTRNLSALKLELLNTLGCNRWPAVNSYYYENKELYDKAAKEAGRESLNCMGGPWPVVMDLIAYIAKSYFKNFNKIKLNSVIALGSNGRLTGVSDVIKLWYEKIGTNLIATQNFPIFIANNSIHAIPNISNHLMNNILGQDTVTARHIYQQTNNYIRDPKSKEKRIDFSSIRPSVIGPSHDRIHLSDALDSLAKSLYDIKQNFMQSCLQFNSEKEEKYLSPQKVHVNRIYRYIDCPLKLADAAIDLALYYHLERQLIKTAGLFNFARNVLAKVKDKKLDALTNTIAQSTLVNLDVFLNYSTDKLEIKHDEINLNKIREEDFKNKQQLIKIRNNLLNLFNRIRQYTEYDIKTLYQQCFNMIKQFIAEITRQCLQAYQNPTINYALIFLGSHSRVMGTPYSDIESCVITDNKKIMLEIIKFQLLKIINLGETVLSALGIPGLEAGKLYDNYTPKGLSFDVYDNTGCKTPLGIKNSYRLIGTPRELVNVACNKNLDFHMFQLMQSNRLVCGNKQLYLDYNIEIFSNKSNFNSRGYYVALFKKDIDLSIYRINEFIKNKELVHKKYFYRPIQVFIEDLFGYLGYNNKFNPYQKLKILCKYDFINQQDYLLLINILNTVLYVRFQQVTKYNEHKYTINEHGREFKPLYDSQEQLLIILNEFRDLYDIYDRIMIIKSSSLAYQATLTDLQVSNILFFKKNQEIPQTKDEDFNSQLTHLRKLT